MNFDERKIISQPVYCEGLGDTRYTWIFNEIMAKQDCPYFLVAWYNGDRYRINWYDKSQDGRPQLRGATRVYVTLADALVEIAKLEQQYVAGSVQSYLAEPIDVDDTYNWLRIDNLTDDEKLELLLTWG